MTLSKLQIGIIGSALSFINMCKDKEFIKYINRLGKDLVDKKQIEEWKRKADEHRI